MKFSKHVCCTGSAHNNFDFLSNRPFQHELYGNGRGSLSVGGSRPCVREAAHCTRYEHQEVAFLSTSHSFFTPPPVNVDTNLLVKTKNIGLAYWSTGGDRSSFKSIY